MIRVSLGLELKSKFIHCFSRHSSMKPHQKIGLSSLALPPKSPRPGEARHLASWNWQLEPELWARSLRQQLNAQLLMVPEEKRVGLSSDETSSDALKSWHSICVLDSKEEPLACQQKRRQFVKPATESEQPTVLELLLAELRTLFSAVLQDSSPAAWRYLHAVLGLLPPYRELLVGHLDLLPFLEQLYCWAPWVQTHLHLDLLGAINQAFPPDSSLLDSASHADCCPQKQRLHHRPPCPACPFVQARWSRQQVKEELATWLRPLTLPELQRCLGIVGAQVALEEAVWLDGLSLLPLALATDIPVQYESSDTDNAEEEPVGRKETRSQLDYEVPREKTLQKSSTGFSPETSFLGSQVMTALKTERYLKKIHFLYLNVAPSRYFRPYSLMVVPPDKVNAEHYIFSPFGILHVHPVEGSETMTLGTWHHHCVLWQQLQFIPFFKYCLLRKSFTCWKKNVRLQGLHRLRNFLENHLLLAVPHFGAGLLHISRLLQELHSVSWLPQELDRCYELLDLQKALAKEKHKALRLLHRCLNLCTSILRLVHEDTYHMQQGLQERVQNCDRIRAGQGSIYLQRVQRKQLEQKLKQAEAWWLQLGKFARLVDYMICQSLISILEEQITSFVANILQAPRQKPFLSSQLVFDDHDQLSHVPCVENMIQILTGGLQSVKTSALQVVQSADLKTSSDSLYSEEEDEEEDSKTEFLMPKFQGQPSDAVSIFCGPNVGLVWPWKSHPIAGILEVHGYRLRGQYFPRNYKQLEEDLNNNPQIQQALNIQQVLLEGVLWEVQEFCREHHWITGIYEFLQSWVPQKLEDMRGGPIKNYVTLVSRLNVWQARVSSMPVELLTKGKLLLLSCRDVQTEMESKLDSIRKDILAQVQNECWSLSQQLMTELTNFMHVFRTINSDIHAIAQCTQKLNEANEQYVELEERMEYVRALHELIRNHFSLFSAENEALDISVRRQFRESSIPPRPPPPRPHLLHCPLLAPQLLDMWEAFQFEKSQASEFLLSKRHAIIPKLQQLMAAALAELEGLLGKALSGPFMDPTQDQRSTEHQLISLERQFQNTVSDLSELHHAYVIFTEDETPVPLPICGTRPIVQQQRIWHLYRVISENISEWKCMAFAKFSLAMAQEKTEGWLTEAARMSTTLGLNSPVLQHCMRILGEFRSYLPLLAKLGSLQPQSLNCQCLLRALGLGSLQTIELLTLGQLLTYPLLEFADRINQVWQNENERIHAQETIQQLQRYWEVRQLRLLNFILHVPYEPPASERSKRQVLRSPQWEVVDKDSGTFILSDYSNLQDSIQESLQVLSKILAIQKSGDLNKTALEWMAIMHGLGALLEVWLTFQQKWIFLNKVLHEMKIQFPNADLNSRFKVVDDQYRTLMRISVADPMVLSLVVPSAKRSPYFQGQQLQQLLQAGSVELEGIIMTLESVLYGVCAHFPRLFFLSDSELVALLAARLESCEAQLWVRRCFPHVHAVRFKSCPTGEKNMDDWESSPNAQTQVEALAVLGAGGEEVKLQGPLPLHPDLPKWLASLEKCLRLALVHMLQGCVAARLARGPSLGEALKQLPKQNKLYLQLYVQHWIDLVQAFPWQCVLVAEEVVWRAEMEEALLEWGTLAMVSMHMRKLEVLVNFLRAQRASQGGQSLPSVRQTSLLSALLVMAVTHRDIAQLLGQHQVSDLTDFHWVRQLKYHLGSPHIIPKSPLQSLKTTTSSEHSLSPAACWIDVLGRSFLYNYEYLGPRLGPLPSLLPERPALVLLLALEEVACGTLLGPNGVGKRAIVNSLAQALGRQLVMLPCSPQIEAQCLSNYLNGALQGGAWLLLEKVQQLPPGLLSALGQRLGELHSLYAPLYQEASRNTSTIDPTQPQLLGSGFFEKHHVSMRLGYGCLLVLRALSSAVPANLHLLLRPVALALPDLRQVAELTLLGAGMRDAFQMATRLSKFFSLERELVSGPLPCRLPLLKQILEDTIQTLNVAKEEPKCQQPRSLAAIEEAALLHALLHSPLFSVLNGLHLHNLRGLLCALFPSASQVLAEAMTYKLMKALVVEELQQYRLQHQTVAELNHMAEVLVPATFRFLARQGVSSLLQVHGQQAVCAGVAEVTSMARILHSLLDPHLRLKEEKAPGPEDLSCSDSVAQSFRSSKSSFLNRSQVDSDDVPNKCREHLLAVSSFLFALIWGFGAHLPSRFWPVFDTFIRDSISRLSNYPEPPPSALVFDLHVSPEDGTLVPFTGQYLSSHIKGTLGTFHPSIQTERLLYVVDLLLSRGQPVLLAGEAATGKSVFVEVLVEPHHPYIYSPIHPAFSSTHLRLLLSRGIQGQTQASPQPGHHQDSKASLLFLLEDLHLATSDPEKSCQPVLETLRQAMDGTVYAHSTLELQTLQPTVNFLATVTVPGYCERPLCPRLFRLFTVLALESMTQATLLDRHVPIIQAWLERFPSVERERALARALVRASVEAWEAVCNCFMPSPLHPHYHFSPHSVSHLLSNLQLLPNRTGSRGFVDYPNHQEHLRRVSGLRGTRLTIMMATRNVVRLWLHEAQRTFCDRLDSPRERSYCAKLLLVVAQSVFCCGPGPQNLGKDHEEDEEEEERVPEVESEGELAQWEDFSNSNSETEEEEEPYGLQVATGSNSSDPSLTPSIGPVSRGMRESISHKIRQEKGTRASNYRLQVRRSFKTWWQKAPQMDLVSPLLLPVLLLHPQEKPSDVVFSQELTLGPNSETPNLYLERQWEKLEEQLATSAAQLKLSPHLARCHSMAQHVARLVRVLARPRQHGLLLSGALGTGRHTAITLASSICQTHFFHLPSGSEEDILQCLRDASWRAGLLSQPVALLVPSGVDLTTLHRLLALATSGSFPGQYTEADLDRIEEHFPRENLGVKQNIKKEMVLQRFHQQVCSHLHLFFLIGDKQAHKQLPSTLFLRLLQLATASIDRYEPWDQAALVKVAQHHLEGARSLPLDDGSWKYPDLQASIPSVAKAMALIHLSATHYHEHLCPALPLVTPKTFLDFLDTFLMLQQQTILKIKNKAQRVQNALDNLRMLIKEHGTHANLISDLEQQLKASSKSLSMFQQQLEQSKLLYKQQLEECRHQENLIEDLAKQRDALQAQQEAFLEQMSKAFLEPLSQLQVADFEEIRSYRAPPESVVRVTDAMCDLFHRETGWASAKQLLCTEDFYQELVFFPKEKITDSQLIKLHLILKAPGMSDAALRAVSRPAASLAAWLWAVLHYGLAHCRGLPTGLLLQQVEATLIREQARLGYYQFQAQETLENNLALAKMVEDAQASHNCVAKTLSQAQRGQYHKWPMKAALLMPMHAWTIQLQKLKGRCMTVFGDALLCSAAIIYLGPFPPLRRQELLDKWLALCRGFQEALGPDDVAQALKQKQKSVSIPPKNPLLATHSPFNILSLLSSASEQYQWDGNLKPQAKSAHLAGLLLRSPTHYSSCRWPLLLDPSNQALMWLDPLSLAENRCLAPAPTEGRGKGLMRNQNTESKMDMKEEDDDSEDSNEAEDQTKEQKAEERKNEQEKEQEENEEKEEKTESQGSKPAYETQLPSLPYLSVLSGADPELGSQLQEAAACGLPVLLTNVELGLGCQELQWLLQREQLSPPQVQPGFCLYLSTTLSLCAMEKVLGCELLKGLNVLDLGLNMEILEEQMLHEILCRECPELETRWQNLKIRALDTCKAVEAAEERLLTMLLFQNPKRQKPAKFLRNMVRAQGKLCQLRAHCEELEGQKLQEMVSWAPYRPVVWHGIAMVKALSQLQNLLPLFRMSPEKWLAVTKQALDSMKPREINHGEDLASHLLQLRAHLTRQLLGSTVTALGLTQVPLVGALGALALLQVTGKASELERLALWPGLAASPSTVHSKPVSGVARPAWLGPKAWHECEMLELLPPFVGLCASLAGHSNAWQAYLSLSSTVLGPAPGPGPEPLSLLQKLILWRVLRPECLAGALADFTTSLLGRPLDENMGAPTMPFKHSRATQPMLILLPLPGHPTATLHPLTVIQNLAAKYQQGQKHLQVIALGSEVWDPVSVVVSTLSQAMYEGHWLVLDNCHLMPHWPKELLQLLLELLGRAKVVADLESEQLLGQPESRNVATVHRDFRLWLIVPAESSASLPAVLTQHSMPVFWNQSLELGHVLIDSVELAQQGLYMQPPTQALPLLLLHGLLLHRQLYGTRLQAHRGRWSQVTLTQVLQTQDQLWASLSNPRAAMQELAASVFYGGPLGDTEDREALFSLTQACLSPSSRNWVQPHTPQSLLATLMPLPELRELDAMAECKAQMHLLPSPPEPRLCGLSEGPQAWLLRRQSRVLLSALQRSSPVWVPESRGGAQLAERRLRQRLVQVNRRLESLQDLLTNLVRQDESGAPKSVLGPNARRPLEGVLETEALELSRLVGTLQRDLDCLLQQLKGAPPCPSRRCAAVAHALWTGRLPLPWRPHAPAGPQPPWHWLRQLSRRGQLLVRYLGVGADANSDVPERVFHLSAFRHPRRLLLALRGEAALDQNVPSSNFPGSRGAVSSPLPYKRLEMNSNPLHLRVENGPNPTVPERGLLLIGLQVLHAEWDPIAGALQDSPSSQASPLPPVSISTQAPGTSDLPPPADLPVYSCPVYMGGPLGNTKLQSRNIVMHLPLPTKLTPNTCVQRRVHVCSPPLS
ncbi:PREDICTED: dynein heavy chain domain-containing protein 1 isoform X12 [Cercocebus atys]|uniref:dynein heavy chain domain-containing protein 1 isoform X12 n=1 Tax=Cercocebus atys TaxID=9531 RepID=UPI0005F4DA94|nr:PREDICTED: dynein heavy chain domain-containing protein 1 isoform X12 [Cercocebus atys]